MLHVRRARIPAALLPPVLARGRFDPLEPAVLCDLVIEGRRIMDVSAAAGGDGAPGATVIDAAGALVFPGFVDAHVHLDKTHTWNRAPNRSGTFWGAMEPLNADKRLWTEPDLRRRAGFALRTAWAHGTRVIRTHLDTGPDSEISHATLAALREEWRGQIEIQTVSLCGGEAYLGKLGEALADMAIRHGASALGGFIQMSDTLDRQIAGLLAIARERRVGIDLHVDENPNPQAEVLRHVAEGVLRTGFPHPVVCGHCCSLAVQDPARARSTIALVREAKIGIISLPLCNVYLQDRVTPEKPFPRSPRWRGLTLIEDLLDAGVPVACAGDNVRDAFFAFGDYDPMEVYQQSLRLAHLDNRLADSVRVVTSTAADLVGRPEFGRVVPGAPAHLVVFEARSFSELLARAAGPRRGIDGETVASLVPPPYSELGDLGELPA